MKLRSSKLGTQYYILCKISREAAFFDERLKKEEGRVKKTCQTMSTKQLPSF